MTKEAQVGNHSFNCYFNVWWNMNWQKMYSQVSDSLGGRVANPFFPIFPEPQPPLPFQPICFYIFYRKVDVQNPYLSIKFYREFCCYRSAFYVFITFISYDIVQQLIYFLSFRNGLFAELKNLIKIQRKGFRYKTETLWS